MRDGGKRRGLGRGLSALLGEDPVADFERDGGQDAKNGVSTVPVERLRPGRFQPRRIFAEQPIDDLADSIREKGILQPIIVRPLNETPGEYEIIAGERRWRAAQKVQLHEVPVVIRALDDRQAMEVALVENLQRQDLSPFEEAEGYRRLLEEFEHGQEDLARAVGKSRSHVANTLRLLGLPVGVRELVEEGALSAGHARALLGAGEEADVEALARSVAARGLNVRQTEALVRKGPAKRRPRTAKGAGAPKDADTLALERDLSDLLGLRVTVDFDGSGGAVTIRYGNLEQLDAILQRLSHGRGAGLSPSGRDSGDDRSA